MRDLFSMDKQDYNPEGRVFRRPSIRGIAFRDDKVLLVYSKKYNYYKFPGGGSNGDESHAQTLVREVLEESGYRVIPESIEEYGRVLRRRKDDYDPECIFEQENFYYFCDVSDQAAAQKLDDYEAEEGFTPVWIEAIVASRHNRYAPREKGADEEMLYREAKVLDMADLEIRKRSRLRREQEALAQMAGDADYAEMLRFVEQTLSEVAEYAQSGKSDIVYTRFAHTKRVLGWALRLYEASGRKDELRYEDLMIATIFHDVGRTLAVQNGQPHALVGVPITREYLTAHGYPTERVEYICSLVGAHSDKERMQEPDLDPNLMLLMEADLLDDQGALGIVMDCMISQARNPEGGFEGALDHIIRFTKRIQQDNPMATSAGRKLWEEKTELVERFVEALRRDMEIGI